MLKKYYFASDVNMLMHTNPNKYLKIIPINGNHRVRNVRRVQTNGQLLKPLHLSDNCFQLASD